MSVGWKFYLAHRQPSFRNRWALLVTILMWFLVCHKNAIRLFSLVLVAFDMYDLDHDGKISRNELLSVLHMMVGSHISEDQVGVTTFNMF